MPHTRRARGLGFVLVGLLSGMLLITPATAHFTQNTKHLGQHVWNQVVKKKVYSKKQANNRFVQGRKFHFSSSAVVNKGLVLQYKGLRLEADCNGTNLTLYADTTVPNGKLASHANRMGLGEAQVEDADFDPGDDVQLNPGVTPREMLGHLRYLGGDGRTVVVEFGAEGSPCNWYGVAFG